MFEYSRLARRPEPVRARRRSRIGIELDFVLANSDLPDDKVCESIDGCSNQAVAVFHYRVYCTHRAEHIYLCVPCKAIVLERFGPEYESKGCFECRARLVFLGWEPIR